MIYKGTFPDRPVGDDQLNAVDMTDTGRGKWARSLVKHGKGSGANRRPAQAFLRLARYWTELMPQGDKDWWIARAGVKNWKTRDGSSPKTSGWDFFLMANMPKVTLGEGMIKIPLPFTWRTDSLWVYGALEADQNRLKFYHYAAWLLEDPWHHTVHISLIKKWNITDDDPLKMTRLIGSSLPNHLQNDWEPPRDPIFLPVPWPVRVGDVLGLHLVATYGGRHVNDPFNVFNWIYPVYKLTAT